MLAQHGDEAKILAGGQSLVPMLALRLARPEVLVDVNRVRELAAVRRENGSLVVGATTRHATLERPGDRCSVAVARPGGTTHRPLPDPQPGDARRVAGARRPGGRAACAGCGCWTPRSRSRARGAPAASRPRTSSRPSSPRPSSPTSWSLRSAFPCGAPDPASPSRRWPAGTVTSRSSVPWPRYRSGTAGCRRSPSGSPGWAACPSARSGGACAHRYLRRRPRTRDAGVQAVADLEPSADVHAGPQYRKRVGAALVAQALTHAIEEATRA